MAERSAIPLPKQSVTRALPRRPLAKLLLAAVCLLTLVCTPAARQGYPPPPGSYDSEYTPPPQRSTATEGAARPAKRDTGGSVPLVTAPAAEAAARDDTYRSTTRFGAQPRETRHGDDPSAATARTVRRPSADAAADSRFLPTPIDDAGVHADYPAGGFRPAVGPGEWDDQRAAPPHPAPWMSPRGTRGTVTPVPAAPARPAYPTPAGPAVSKRNAQESTAWGFYPGAADTSNRPADAPQAPAGGAVFRPVD